MAAIEGKSVKVKGEIETVQSHINLNTNRLRTAEQDIHKFKEDIIKIDRES